MNAAALTHYAKIRGFNAQDYERLRQNERQRVKDRETGLEQLCLQPPYSLGKNSRPSPRGGRLELSLPPKHSTPIYSKMSWHNTSPDRQMLADMKIY